MEIKDQIKLQFKGVSIVGLNFVSKKVFKDGEVHTKIDPKVFYPGDRKDRFKIIMDVNISAPDCFDLSLIAVGDFIFNKDVTDQELRKKFVNANSVAIMFPYVRSFITTLTSNIGRNIPTIILPTQFFKGDDIEELSKNLGDTELIDEAK